MIHFLSSLLQTKPKINTSKMLHLFGKTRFTKLTVYNTVKDVVKKNPYKSICQFYFDKVVVGEYVNNDTNVLRIWKNNATIGIDKSYTGGDRFYLYW